MVVAGTAILDGTLVVATLFDYLPNPSAGHEYQILTAGELTGQFETVEDFLVASDVAMVPLYNFSGHTGVTIKATIPGDANFDGSIDVADLGILGVNFHLTDLAWTDGDFNFDGTVDVSDLGLLGANWSDALAPTFSNIFEPRSMKYPVPEPSALVTFSLLASLIGRQKQKC